MKILIIMGGFFPGRNYGGPPVSTDNFCSLMKDSAKCYIVTLNHDKGEKEKYCGIKDGWNDRGNCNVIYLSDDKYCLITFRQVIKEVRPDYIYLQGLFQKCIWPCLRLAKVFGIKVVLAPRGELCAGAFKKKYKKIPYIWTLRMSGLLKNTVFQSTSAEESEAIKKYLGVDAQAVHMLTNIPSIPNNLPQRIIKKRGEGKFVFISRILWKKNLLAAINYLKDLNGKIVFDVYGPIEDENYWGECKQTINILPSNVIVNYKGVLSHDDIHKTFSMYDAFIFPTLSENYGHVIAEALVTGCIPIISDQTPWTDMNNAGAGYAIPLDEETRFIKAIQEVIDMDESQIENKRKVIKSYLDNKLRIDELKKEYLNVFK